MGIWVTGFGRARPDKGASSTRPTHPSPHPCRPPPPMSTNTTVPRVLVRLGQIWKDIEELPLFIADDETRERAQRRLGRVIQMAEELLEEYERAVVPDGTVDDMTEGVCSPSEGESVRKESGHEGKRKKKVKKVTKTKGKSGGSKGKSGGSKGKGAEKGGVGDDSEGEGSGEDGEGPPATIKTLVRRMDYARSGGSIVPVGAAEGSEVLFTHPPAISGGAMRMEFENKAARRLFQGWRVGLEWARYLRSKKVGEDQSVFADIKEEERVEREECGVERLVGWEKAVGRREARNDGERWLAGMLGRVAAIKFAVEWNGLSKAAKTSYHRESFKADVSLTAQHLRAARGGGLAWTNLLKGELSKQFCAWKKKVEKEVTWRNTLLGLYGRGSFTEFVRGLERARRAGARFDDSYAGDGRVRMEGTKDALETAALLIGGGEVRDYVGRFIENYGPKILGQVEAARGEGGGRVGGGGDGEGGDEGDDEGGDEGGDEVGSVHGSEGGCRSGSDGEPPRKRRKGYNASGSVSCGRSRQTSEELDGTGPDGLWGLAGGGRGWRGRRAMVRSTSEEDDLEVAGYLGSEAGIDQWGGSVWDSDNDDEDGAAGGGEAGGGVCKGGNGEGMESGSGGGGGQGEEETDEEEGDEESDEGGDGEDGEGDNSSMV
ncbi:hypothetical protein BV25DRAFT_1839024 [Artomyces pyxidatus]|uniref:Uncharacterized protein n=1 Tax=Artomyces pyxidatus TaxID=48021 RepID=A0ACB8SZF4_9AGAM|nr:hypothetical protein BV25DRAFT_1839024 [Artomyces pyxidatus]